MNHTSPASPPTSLPPALVLRVVEAFEAASKDTMKQLRSLYALKAAGKRGVDVPPKLDVLVTVKLDDLTAPLPISAAPAPLSSIQSASESQIALDRGSQV